MQFINYHKCTTCKNALEYLKGKNIEFIDRQIKEDIPTKNELSWWINKFDIDIKKLFNTSGLLYRKLNLKEKLKDMSDEEKIELLSSDGMLIKRPLLVSDNKILIGFKKQEWDNYFE